MLQMSFLTLQAADITTEYAMLMLDGELSSSETEASAWFTTNYVNQVNAYNVHKGTILRNAELTSTSLNPKVTKVVWVEIDREGFSLETNGLTDDQLNNLKQYVKDGGNLYVSSHATKLVKLINRIDCQVSTYNSGGTSPNSDTWGIRANMNNKYNHENHPIYEGLTFENFTNGHGVKLTDANPKYDHNSMWTLTDYTANANHIIDFEVKTNSIVLGTWQQDDGTDNAAVVEFLPVADYKGRIIANGIAAYQWAASGNNYETNIEKLTGNILTYLSTRKLKKVAYLLPDNLTGTYSTDAEYNAAALALVDPDDEKTALQWFIDEIVSSGKGVILQPKHLADLDPTEVSTMWIHIDRDNADTKGGEPNKEGKMGKKGETPSTLDRDYSYEMLVRYVKNGGNLLLTKHAVQIVQAGYLGRSTMAPNMISWTYTADTKKTSSDAWAINPVIGAGYVNATEYERILTAYPDHSSAPYNYFNGNSDDDPEFNSPGLYGQFPSVGDDKYVSYYWVQNNHYLPTLRNSSDIFDHRNNHLYYNMTLSENVYPIIKESNFDEGDTDGKNHINDYGKYKYEVYLIEAGGNVDGTGTALYKEDHNALWAFDASGDGDYAVTFQNNNKCNILGQWGHKSKLDNAAIVEFKPANVDQIGDSKPNNNNTWAWNNDAWEGQILCIGLGAYEWQPSYGPGDDTGMSEASKSWGDAKENAKNEFIGEIKQLTYNALNILENDFDDTKTTTFTVGGVTYVGTVENSENKYATIIDADPKLEVYDLTANPDGSSVGNGMVTYGGNTYKITNVGLSAFANCKHLAFADLMQFQGDEVPGNIRSSFPAQTLIYLPKETATSIADCRVKGENIVNQLSNGNRVCEHLKVYDLVPGSDPNDYDFTWFANKYAFTAYQVSYDREFPTNTEDYMATIALPFSITAEEAAQLGEFYWYKGMTADNTLRFFNANGVAAHHPYLFVPTYKEGGVPVSISISNVEKTIPQLDAAPAFNSETQKYSLTTPLTVTPGGDMSPDAGCGAFYASFRPQVVGDWSDTPEEENTARYLGYYCFSDGEFKAWDYIFLDPYRCYLLAPGKHIWEETEGGAKGLGIKLEYIDYTPEPQTNGISNLSIPSRDNSYYTLSGVRVEKPTRGIYIRNNKKTIVK